MVDDQAAVLDTAVLILRSVDPDWEVSGFKGPFEALEAVKTRAPDLILSDQLMPGMLGSQFLEQVRILSPNAIRIIMSGYVALNKLTLITSAHQYLAKPFDALKLRELIRRSFAAQDRIAGSGLQSLVTSLRSIPSLPQAHHSLLAELESDTSSGLGIAKLVTEDVGVSTKVLQLANSPLFGKGQLITSPIDAVLCLGTDMIAAVVLSQMLFRHYETLSHPEMDLPRIWNHCWQTASLAQYICRDKRLPREASEAAFLAGVVHEVGRFILIDNFPSQYITACQAARQLKSPLRPRLLETFQVSPAQIAGYLLELWGMPPVIISSVSWQDNPREAPEKGFSVAVALYIADHIACHKSAPDVFSPPEWDTDFLKSIGCLEDIPRWEAMAAAQ